MTDIKGLACFWGDEFFMWVLLGRDFLRWAGIRRLFLVF